MSKNELLFALMVFVAIIVALNTADKMVNRLWEERLGAHQNSTKF